MPTVIEPFGGIFSEIADGRVYMVNYSEDLWKAFDAEGQQFCKDTWIKKATPIANIKYVVLRLIPDELFPMHGHETPYVEWQHEIERAPECGFTLEATFTVCVPYQHKQDIPVNMYMDIRKKIRAAAVVKEGHWQIVSKGGNVLDHGSL